MAKRFDVLTPRTRKDKETGEEKTFWCRIGSAWLNDKRQLNVTLDALPIDGKLLIAEAKERDDRAPSGGGKPQQQQQSDDIPF